MKYKLAVFCYDFPHLKSELVIKTLFNHKIRDVIVIAAPKVVLGFKNNLSSFPSLPKTDTNLRDLCKDIGYSYFVVPHSNILEITSLVREHDINIGIIGGARILVKEIIDLFKFGIINYHPGPLPETSGLDSFFWMVKKDCPPSVSAHFIDHRVDAGSLIAEKKTKFSIKSDIGSIVHNLFFDQIELHNELSKKIKNNQVIKATKINRLKKNKPMSETEKEEVLNAMTIWKKKYAS